MLPRLVLNSRPQAILSPWPPKGLELQVGTTVPGQGVYIIKGGALGLRSQIFSGLKKNLKKIKI